MPPAVAAELTALKSTNQAVDTWDAEVRQSLLKLSQEAKAGKIADIPYMFGYTANDLMDMTKPVKDFCALRAEKSTKPTSVTNSDGTNARLLKHLDGVIDAAAWSPDGI